MKAYLFFTVLAISISVYAAKPAKEVTPSQCLHKAKQIAKNLDEINGDVFAKQVITATVTTEYNDADLENTSVATYTFGEGESYLEVVIRPDYYRNGDCNFVSATIISQD